MSLTKFKLSLRLMGAFILGCTSLSNAQILTREDSLSANLVAKDRTTVLSGYGEANIEYNLKYQTGTADLKRSVLFLGHKFNNNISFFSEMELEHAFVSSNPEGESDAEISMEQLFLKFNVTPNHYFVAGLFIPRIGIINENHLPTTFNGMSRPAIEQHLIPSTWREIGVAFYGISSIIPGLNYTIGLMNGLQSSHFSMNDGIREGRGLGNESTASNLAVHASALKYQGNCRFQASYYFGGSAGLSKREADSLQLSYGTFGSPVQVAESNFQYRSNGFTIKSLLAWINIIDAAAINRAYAQNVSEQSLGGYLELGYNILEKSKKWKEKNLTLFSRLEYMDLDYKPAKNGIINNELNKSYWVSGISFYPTNGVVIKADYTIRKTGERNQDLIPSPFPTSLPFFTEQSFFNLGIGYSF